MGELGAVSKQDFTDICTGFWKEISSGSSGTKAGGGVGTVEHHGPDAADTLCSETVRK